VEGRYWREIKESFSPGKIEMTKRTIKTRVKEKLKRNWKDSNDYKLMKDYSPERWAWEFLRRNPEYREDWKKLTNGLSEKEKKYFLHFRSCEKWGLKNYLDPDMENPNICGFIPPGGDPKAIYQLDPKTHLFIDRARPNPKTGEIILRFNVKEPINPQIEVAKKKLMEFQEETMKNENGIRKAFKPRREEWITLIRLLDAMADRTSNKEIARALFPKDFSDDDPKATKKLFDKKEQARRYLEQEYRLIPFSEK
jgi:hypothetical protein